MPFSQLYQFYLEKTKYGDKPHLLPLITTNEVPDKEELVISI